MVWEEKDFKRKGKSGAEIKSDEEGLIRSHEIEKLESYTQQTEKWVIHFIYLLQK